MVKMVGNLGNNPQDLINKLIEENNKLKRENKELKVQLENMQGNTYSDNTNEYVDWLNNSEEAELSIQAYKESGVEVQ